MGGFLRGMGGGDGTEAVPYDYIYSAFFLFSPLQSQL